MRGGATYYYHTDALGSITDLSDSSGNGLNAVTYTTFGSLASGSPTVANPFQYTGREFDSETGLYYYRARYYDPSVGRFISEDPVRFQQGTNFYRYARNNPVNLVDPSGLYVELLCEPVHQWGLGIIVRGKHCRVHVRCDKPGNKYDVTYELNGPGAGSLRADLFDPSRPVDPFVPVKPPADGGCCKFENCISKRFAFYFMAAAHGGNALPDYGAVNQNSNAFARDLVRSCGGQLSFPLYPVGYYGQMSD